MTTDEWRIRSDADTITWWRDYLNALEGKYDTTSLETKQITDLILRLDAATTDRDRYLAALTAIDEMDPDEYKTGQEHLSPAFREPNLREGMRFICRTINGVLHNTDEYGEPL